VVSDAGARVQVGLVVLADGVLFAYEQFQYMQGKTPFQ